MIKLILAFILSTTPVMAALSQSDIAKTPIRNALLNPGAENGTVGWSVSTGSFTASNSTPLDGNASFVWDASASTQTLSSAITVPEWLKGQNAVVSCQVRCATGTCTHSIRALVAGSSVASASITSSTTASPRATVNFIAPTSGAIGVELYANADEPSLKIDNCYIARADEWNLVQLSQARLLGTVKVTGCSGAWTTTSSSYGDYTTQTSCSYAVTGSLTAPATNIPGVRLAGGGGSGTYVLKMSGTFGKNSAANYETYYRVSDGTNTGPQESVVGSSAAASLLAGSYAEGNITYTNSIGDTTFRWQGKSDGTNANAIYGTTGLPVTFSLYYYPSSTETAARVDTLPASWSGYHGSDCSWARTNTAYGDPTADATCTFTERTNRNAGTVTSYLSGSDKLPGIVMSISRFGMKMICTRFGSLNGSTGTLGYRVTDGTAVIFELNDSSQTTYKSQYGCGIYNATSIGSKTFRLESKASSSSATISTEAGTPSVEWTVFDLDQSFPAAYIANSVTSNTSGQERVERARVGTTNATTVCSASPCSFVSQSGSWLTSVSRGSAGVYTLNIAAGIFSDVPSCSISAGGGGSLIYRKTTAATSTSWTIAGETTGGTPTDFYFDVQCMGPR